MSGDSAKDPEESWLVERDPVGLSLSAGHNPVDAEVCYCEGVHVVAGEQDKVDRVSGVEPKLPGKEGVVAEVYLKPYDSVGGGVRRGGGRVSAPVTGRQEESRE